MLNNNNVLQKTVFRITLFKNVFKEVNIYFAYGSINIYIWEYICIYMYGSINKEYEKIRNESQIS